jgi:hypothetical protein
MAVEAVGREVERAVLEPADAEIGLVEAGVLDLGEGLDPVEPAPSSAQKASGSSTERRYIAS